MDNFGWNCVWCPSKKPIDLATRTWQMALEEPGHKVAAWNSSAAGSTWDSWGVRGMLPCLAPTAWFSTSTWDMCRNFCRFIALSDPPGFREKPGGAWAPDSKTRIWKGNVKTHVTDSTFMFPQQNWHLEVGHDLTETKTLKATNSKRKAHFCGMDICEILLDRSWQTHQEDAKCEMQMPSHDPTPHKVGWSKPLTTIKFKNNRTNSAESLHSVLPDTESHLATCQDSSWSCTQRTAKTWGPDKRLRNWGNQATSS